MLVHLYTGFYVDPELVAVVKATGKKSCALFTAGQSATDAGFALPYSAAEIVDELNDPNASVEGKPPEEEGEEDEEEQDDE